MSHIPPWIVVLKWFSKSSPNYMRSTKVLICLWCSFPGPGDVWSVVSCKVHGSPWWSMCITDFSKNRQRRISHRSRGARSWLCRTRKRDLSGQGGGWGPKWLVLSWRCQAAWFRWSEFPTWLYWALFFCCYTEPERMSYHMLWHI